MPRKLGVPGEELPKVMYSLIDTEGTRPRASWWWGEELSNDYVWVFAGGTPPNELLTRIGVPFGPRDLTAEAGAEAWLAATETPLGLGSPRGEVFAGSGPG